MPDAEQAGVPRKALKFVGNVAEGQYVPGIPAQDLTEDQATVWVRDDLYREALASGWYEEATRTEAKEIEQATAEASTPTDAGTEPAAPARAKARK